MGFYNEIEGGILLGIRWVGINGLNEQNRMGTNICGRRECITRGSFKDQCRLCRAPCPHIGKHRLDGIILETAVGSGDRGPFRTLVLASECRDCHILASVGERQASAKRGSGSYVGRSVTLTPTVPKTTILPAQVTNRLRININVL